MSTVTARFPVAAKMSGQQQQDRILDNHPWYHGNIARERAEMLVVKDGDFLVRDSISNPGDYVVTCYWGLPLHFMINRQTRGTGYFAKPVYRFEEEFHDSVAGLINFYVTGQKTVTQASGARIRKPVPRRKISDTMNPVIANLQSKGPIYSPTRKLSGPLTEANKVAPVPQRRSSQPQLTAGNGGDTKEASGYLSTPVPPHIDRHSSAPQIKSPKEVVIEEKSCIQFTFKGYRCGSDPNLSRKDLYSPARKLAKVPNAVRGSDSNLNCAPPPKPSRIPSMKYAKRLKRPIVQIRNQELYEDDGKDYTDIEQVLAIPAIIKERNQTKPASPKPYTPPVTFHYDSGQKRTSSSEVPRSPALYYNGQSERVKLPGIDTASTISITTYNSHILPPHNKPLDSASLVRVKMALMNNSPKTVAENITKVDLELLKVTADRDLGVKVTSGLELITLPQGKLMRMDVLERFNCLRLFVALTVLTCTKLQERAQMLHLWIQVALEMKASLGNFMGFAAVMDGLQHPRVSRLLNTWVILRQNHTNSAFIYDAKLCPAHKSLGQGCWALPVMENVSIPNIIPLIELLERPLDNFTAATSWEMEDRDFGLDFILSHLDTARIITEHCAFYSGKAQTILSKIALDADLMDIMSIEFQLFLLWGATGAGVCARDRLFKFDQILSILSERIEPSDAAESSV